MSARFLVCATVTALSALISLGFSLASVPNTTGQTRTLALYTCARSIAFTIISAVPLLTGSGQWLPAAAVGMITVQILDTGVGVTIKNKMKTFGPAGTAIVNLATLIWFVGQ